MAKRGPKAVCRVCRKSFATRGDGTIRKHTWELVGVFGPEECPGGEKEPK